MNRSYGSDGYGYKPKIEPNDKCRSCRLAGFFFFCSLEKPWKVQRYRKNNTQKPFSTYRNALKLATRHIKPSELFMPLQSMIYILHLHFYFSLWGDLWSQSMDLCYTKSFCLPSTNLEIEEMSLNLNVLSRTINTGCCLQMFCTLHIFKVSRKCPLFFFVFYVKTLLKRSARQQTENISAGRCQVSNFTTNNKVTTWSG